MSRIVYEIVQHNGGWAYKAGDVFSETFATHDEAAEAAERAAEGHARSGSSEHIEYEDADGIWHEEDSPGDDRPDISVDDPEEPGRS